MDGRRADAGGQGGTKRLSRRQALIGLSVAVGGALLSLRSRRATAAPREWRIRPGGPVRPEQPFSLFNTTNRRYVRYGERGWGINLAWDTQPRRNFVIARSGAAAGAVVYGEIVALKETNRDAGYLRYRRRPWGINLGWSPAPEFDWEIRGGPVGTPVGQGANPADGAPIDLFNLTEQGNVVYGWRPHGINLVWDPPGRWEPS
jgi:hypothetical protein